MAMTYNTLIAASSVDGSIANWVNHGSAQAVADTIVTEAESYIYRRLRVWQMIKTQTGVSMSLSNQFVVFPSDYLEDRILMIVGENYKRVVRKTPEEVWANYVYDGNGNPVPCQPSFYYSDAVNLNFDTIPDQTYPYQLLYYAQPAPLSTSQTNFITATYPRLMRCAIMIGACEFMKDSGAGNYDRTYWQQQADMEITVAQIESDRSVRSQVLGAILN